MALATAGFSLGIRPVVSLLPHEEVIAEHVDQLCAQITGEGFQRDPIIIDRESATVLDGMHRLAAFRRLKIENAVCCSVDYSSPAVAIGRWARVYTMRKEDSLTAALNGPVGLRRTPLAEAFSALQRREAAVAVLTTDAAFVSEGKRTVADMAEAVLSFDRLAEGRGWARSFVPEDEVDVPLQQPHKFVVLPQCLTKDDVVTAARTGKLIPCKTSMHSIDPRPVAVNFPISELGKASSTKLRERLARTEGRLLPRGSDYGGRRYKERLLRLDGE